MVAIIIINLICIGLLFIGNNVLKLKNNLMPGIVGILTVFFGIRYRYGNDFRMYERIFDYINHSTNMQVEVAYPRVEYGWILLNRMFSFTDFSVLVFLLTFIQFAVFGWFVYKFVDRKRQWIAMALYLFTPSLMLVELSMMRQMLAMSIMTLGVPSMLKKKWIPMLLLTILAAQFHRSAWIGIILIVYPYLLKLDWKVILTGYVFIFIFFYFTPSGMFSMIDLMLDNDEFDRYKHYTTDDGSEMNTGLGFLFQFFTGIYLCWMLRLKQTPYRWSILLLLTHYVMMSMSVHLGVMGRMMIYFLQFGMFGYLALFKRARRDALAMVFSLIFFIHQSVKFVKFFFDPIWTHSYLHYTTIFDI